MFICGTTLPLTPLAILGILCTWTTTKYCHHIPEISGALLSLCIFFSVCMHLQDIHHVTLLSFLPFYIKCSREELGLQNVTGVINTLLLIYHVTF